METLNFDIDDILGRSIGMTLRYILDRMSENLVKFGLNLSLDEMLVLINTWHRPGISQQWFTEMIGKDKTKVTRVIDQLEGKNLVVRIEDKNDRRRKLIYLTNSGKELIHPCIKVAEQTNHEVIAGIEVEDLEICKRVLRQVRKNLAKYKISTK